MSRTKKGAKGAGYEYWSKRPLAGDPPGAETKKRTNRIERRKRKVDTKKEVEE